MSRTALVDADILAYQAAAATERPVYWEDGLWTLHSFEDEAIEAFETALKKYTEAVEATDIILAFSDSENWRKEVLPTYKSNRKGTRKPMLLGFLRAYCEDKYDVFVRPTLEADDVLGILNTSSKLVKGERVVISIDKDFWTIPGEHYNFKDKEFFTVDQETADYHHFMQALMGDATDGYTGCPKIGKVTAKKVLDKAIETGQPLWEAVVTAFQKAGLSEEVALTQARVARILRAEDYDFKKKEVILWEPASLK